MLKKKLFVNPDTLKSAMTYEMLRIVNKKFDMYCIDRVKELGLVPASFSNSLHMMQVSDCRKSLNTLRSIFQKHLSKTLPYLAHTIGGQLKLQDRDFLKIVIGESAPRLNTDVSFYTKAAFYDVGPLGRIKSLIELYDMGYANKLRSIAESDTSTPSLVRYVKYLNYLCRKYGVPLLITLSKKIEFFNSSLSTELEIPRANRNNHVLSSCLLISISSHSPKFPTLTPEESMNKVNRILNGEEPEANWISDVRYWAPYALYMGQALGTPHFYKEKLFFYMSEILTTLKTLTRKAPYGPSAFVVGSPIN